MKSHLEFRKTYLPADFSVAETMIVSFEVIKEKRVFLSLRP